MGWRRTESGHRSRCASRLLSLASNETAATLHTCNDELCTAPPECRKPELQQDSALGDCGNVVDGDQAVAAAGESMRPCEKQNREHLVIARASHIVR